MLSNPQSFSLSVTRSYSHIGVTDLITLRRAVSTPDLTHLEYDSSAVHPGGDCGLLIRAGLVSSYAPLTKAAR